MARQLFWILTCCTFLFLVSEAVHGAISSLELTGSCQRDDVRCNDGRCIPKDWRCDGQRDCRDGSDELNCPPFSCTARQFRCDNTRCIPMEWRCDSQKDCQDGSDEDSSACIQRCPVDNFRCTTGQCIPNHWKCDGERDCKDGGDEDLKICAKAKHCFSDERMCRNKECISFSMWCDGKPDCRDGSDELGEECGNMTATEASACAAGQFRCRNGRCLPASWVCDGRNDCAENEDEKTDCSPNMLPFGSQTSVASSCFSEDYTCADSTCIPSNWRCDGGLDCDDGSDEEGCETSSSSSSKTSALTAKSGCSLDQFFCVLWNGTGECLPLSKVCDARHDCRNGTDEGPGCLSACQDNGQCSDICHPTPHGPVCTCLSGFALSSDGKACVDIDECSPDESLSGPCSQKCTNTKGSFKCECADRFMLEMDGVTCKPDVEPLLLYGSDSQINWLTPEESHQGVVTEGRHAFVTVGIDYLEENGTTSIFYSDSERREILQVNLATKQKRTIFGGLSSPEGLAFDWVSHNLYFVDGEKKEIGVCTIRNRTTFCSKVIYTHLNNPRGIAVHPANRMIFFTQWGKDAKIERAWLDGSGRMDIVTHKIVWPNAVTIDFIHERIYWIDARMSWIETAKYDGHDRRTILHLKRSHPFGLTILGNRIFWTDWKNTSINTAFVNGSSYGIIHSTLRRPMGIVSMHPSRQMPSSSSCSVNVANPCDHICLAGPGNLYTCMCHGGFQLIDGSQCVALVPSVGSTTNKNN